MVCLTQLQDSDVTQAALSCTTSWHRPLPGHSLPLLSYRDSEQRERRKGKFPDAASLMELTPLWRERDCLQFTPPAEEIFSSLLELLISALGNASLEWQPLEEYLSSQ